MHHITGNGLRHGRALHRDTLERLCGQTHCYGHILIQFLKCNYFAPQSRCRVLPRPSRCHPWYIKRKINNESEKNKRRHPPGTVSIFRYLTSQLLLFLPSFLNITFYSCLRWKIFFSFLTHQITLSLRLFIGPGKLHVGVIDCYQSLWSRCTRWTQSLVLISSPCRHWKKRTWEREIKAQIKQLYGRGGKDDSCPDPA